MKRKIMLLTLLTFVAIGFNLQAQFMERVTEGYQPNWHGDKASEEVSFEAAEFENHQVATYADAGEIGGNCLGDPGSYTCNNGGKPTITRDNEDETCVCEVPISDAYGILAVMAIGFLIWKRREERAKA